MTKPIQSLLGNLLGWQILFDLFNDAVSSVRATSLLMSLLIFIIVNESQIRLCTTPPQS